MDESMGRQETVSAGRQQFERGWMYWYDLAGGKIFALCEDGEWEVYADEWDGETAIAVESPEGLLAPLRGFGYVWNMHYLQAWLGWAVLGEEAGQGRCLQTPGGGWRLEFGGETVAELKVPMTEESEEETGPAGEVQEPVASCSVPSSVPSIVPGVRHWGLLRCPLRWAGPWNLVMLPGFVFNLAACVWINKMGDGTIRARLVQPVTDVVDFPLGVGVAGDDIMVFAGSHAELLWKRLEELLGRLEEVTGI